MEQTVTLEERENGEKEKAMHDIANNSDCDSDSDSDGEAQQNLQLQALQTEVAANPSNYDSHLQVISSSQLSTYSLFLLLLLPSLYFPETEKRYQRFFFFFFFLFILLHAFLLFFFLFYFYVHSLSFTVLPWLGGDPFQYIKLLRKMGDVEKLRAAREAMSELFPLTPAMWQEWIKDELSLKTGFVSLSFSPFIFLWFHFLPLCICTIEN